MKANGTKKKKDAQERNMHKERVEKKKKKENRQCLQNS